MADTMTEQTDMNGDKHYYFRSVLEAAANADRVMQREKYGAVEIKRLEDGSGELILRRADGEI